MPMLLNAGIETKTYERHFESVIKNNSNFQYLSASLNVKV